MRVLYVIDSLGAGGAEHSTFLMLPELQRRGHEVAVATLYDSKFGDEDRVRASGFAVRPLRAQSWFARVRELRRVVREFAPDIVHTSLFSCDVLGRVAGVGMRAKVVSTVVSTPYVPARYADPSVTPWKLRLVQVVDGLTARCGADRLQAVSDGAADAAARDLRYPRRRITVVERGRDRSVLGMPSPERRATVRAGLGVAAGQPVVLIAARQEHAKGLDSFVEAVDLLRAQVPEVVVLLAGREGNATPALKAALAARPAAAAVIRLLGHRLDVPDLMCAADVMAIPSRYEGTAGSALEAMALRLPVVCTEMEGPRGILVHGVNCRLVPQGDQRAMADELAAVLTNPAKLADMVEHAQTDFERRFGIATAADRLEAFYAEVVQGGTRPKGQGRRRARRGDGPDSGASR